MAYGSCAIDCAGRSMESAGVLVLGDLRRGTASLGAIARIAPLLGALASTLGVRWWLSLPVDWCPGGCCAGGISEAFVPFLLSLPVAVFAYALSYSLAGRLARFESDLRLSRLEILNSLAHYRGRPAVGDTGTAPNSL